MTQAQDVINVEQLNVQTDWATVSATGSAPTSLTSLTEPPEQAAPYDLRGHPTSTWLYCVADAHTLGAARHGDHRRPGDGNIISQRGRPRRRRGRSPDWRKPWTMKSSPQRAGAGHLRLSSDKLPARRVEGDGRPGPSTPAQLKQINYQAGRSGCPPVGAGRYQPGRVRTSAGDRQGQLHQENYRQPARSTSSLSGLPTATACRAAADVDSRQTTEAAGPDDRHAQGRCRFRDISVSKAAIPLGGIRL
jgi:hypothetical protein